MTMAEAITTIQTQISSVARSYWPGTYYLGIALTAYRYRRIRTLRRIVVL